MKDSYKIVKWVGPSDFISRIGQPTWEEHCKTDNQADCLKKLQDLTLQGIRAAWYKNGVLKGLNYA